MVTHFYTRQFKNNLISFVFVFKPLFSYGDIENYCFIMDEISKEFSVFFFKKYDQDQNLLSRRL